MDEEESECHRCSICGHRDVEFAAVVRHLLVHFNADLTKDEDVICADCDFEAENRFVLAEHRARVHCMLDDVAEAFVVKENAADGDFNASRNELKRDQAEGAKIDVDEDQVEDDKIDVDEDEAPVEEAEELDVDEDDFMGDEILIVNVADEDDEKEEFEIFFGEKSVKVALHGNVEEAKGDVTVFELSDCETETTQSASFPRKSILKTPDETVKKSDAKSRSVSFEKFVRCVNFEVDSKIDSAQEFDIVHLS